jgi:hypothetical protein
MFLPRPDESLQRTDEDDIQTDATADDMSWRIDEEVKSQFPKSTPIMLIDVAAVVGEFWAAARARCISKDIANDRAENWRDTVEVIEMNVAEELGTLATTELSDTHNEETLFVDPSFTNEVWPIKPNPRPWADTNTDPLFGASLGLTTEMWGHSKVNAFEREPTAKELKTETDTSIRLDVPWETFNLSVESDDQTEFWHVEACRVAELHIDREPMADPTVCTCTAPVDGDIAFVRRWMTTTSQLRSAGSGNKKRLACLLAETTTECLP